MRKHGDSNEHVDPVVSVTEAAAAILRELRTWDWLHGNFDWPEKTCTQELAAQLTAEGAFPTTTGPGTRYPKSRRMCDLILLLPGGGRLWLENKIAYWIWPTNCRGVNRGLCTMRLTSRTENSAYRDITEKLPLVRNVGDFVGQLVIGFDAATESLDPLIDQLVQEAGLSGSEWLCFYDDWPNPESDAYRVRAWLWCRAAVVLESLVAV
jgi:hypothetical protein